MSPFVFYIMPLQTFSFFADFSRSFLSRIFLRKRIDSGVTSQYSSSFKYSSDSSNVKIRGFLITLV